MQVVPWQYSGPGIIAADVGCRNLAAHRRHSDCGRHRFPRIFKNFKKTTKVVAVLADKQNSRQR
ncbi:hypothetical protein [Sideroxyarcus emersonii]|uniref:hypothetical protein n=1 Tax=Sideroxyarcus emersonii TaxID=2764705 RepID=UPI001F1B434B|nr:hypothetical protein [Sideroxyarcus emersonii]